MVTINGRIVHIHPKFPREIQPFYLSHHVISLCGGFPALGNKIYGIWPWRIDWKLSLISWNRTRAAQLQTRRGPPTCACTYSYVSSSQAHEQCTLVTSVHVQRSSFSFFPFFCWNIGPAVAWTAGPARTPAPCAAIRSAINIVLFAKALKSFIGFPGREGRQPVETSQLN